MSLQFLTTSCWHGGGLQLGDRATPLVVGLKRQCSRFSWRRGKRGSTGRPSSCRRSGTQAAVLARRRSFLYSAWPDSAGWPSLHVSTLTLAADGARKYNGCIEEKGPLWEFWRQRWPWVSQIRNSLGKPIVQHSMTTRQIHHLHVQTAPWRSSTKSFAKSFNEKSSCSSFSSSALMNHYRRHY